VNPPNPETIRLLPALVISAEDLSEGLRRLGTALAELRRAPA
jgi:acetylornithine/succinyldiaminopimelate/putrescine aminotransferase